MSASVPRNRPADALAALGFRGIRIDTPHVCAVLRSWGERFAVFPLRAERHEGGTRGRCPTDDLDQALRLAAEILVVAPLNDSSMAGRIRNLAHVLLD